MKKNRGMTLAEIIVTLAILSIIMAVTLPLLASASAAFTKEQNMNSAKLMGDGIYQFVTDRLVFADEIKVSEHRNDADDASYGNVMETVGGEFWFNGENLYGSDFYLGHGVKTEATILDDNKLEFKVTVSDRNGDPLYQTVSALCAANIRITGRRMEGIQGSIYENPVIYYNYEKVNLDDLMETETGVIVPPKGGNVLYDEEFLDLETGNISGNTADKIGVATVTANYARKEGQDGVISQIYYTGKPVAMDFAHTNARANLTAKFLYLSGDIHGYRHKTVASEFILKTYPGYSEVVLYLAQDIEFILYDNKDDVVKTYTLPSGCYTAENGTDLLTVPYSPSLLTRLTDEGVIEEKLRNLGVLSN